jgi:hypothetical protein
MKLLIRIRLANSATAKKKQTMSTGIIISTQARGSRPPKQSAWKIPVPTTPMRAHIITA